MEKQKLELVQLYPKTREECDKEFDGKFHKHKWLFLILNKELAEQIKIHIQRWKNKKLVVLDNSATQQYFKEIKDKRSITRWINLTQLDGEQISWRQIKLKGTNEISILYCGMNEEEIDKSINLFQQKVRDAQKMTEEINNSQKAKIAEANIAEKGGQL